MSVYLFPDERSGAQPPLPPVGVLAGSLGSCSEAEESENEKEGDGDTLDSDEFCILDAPGLGIPVRGGQAGQVCEGGSAPALLEMECGKGRRLGGPHRGDSLSLGFAGAGYFQRKSGMVLGRGLGHPSGKRAGG